MGIGGISARGGFIGFGRAVAVIVVVGLIPNDEGERALSGRAAGIGPSQAQVAITLRFEIQGERRDQSVAANGKVRVVIAAAAGYQRVGAMSPMIHPATADFRQHGARSAFVTASAGQADRANGHDVFQHRPKIPAVHGIHRRCARGDFVHKIQIEIQSVVLFGLGKGGWRLQGIP